MEDTFIKYEYEVTVENTLYPIIVCYRGTTQTIEYPILRFDNTEKLTKDECYDIMKGIRGILSITGDFKEIEENKYYTPELSEFFVGFEYEYAHGGYDWAKYTFNFTPNTHTLFVQYLKEKHIRVKILDQFDIESTGFILVDKMEKGYSTPIGSSLVFKKKFKDDKWTSQLIVDIYNNIHIKIWKHVEMYPDMAVNVFLGKIKNKSILKQILKMIGVSK